LQQRPRHRHQRFGKRSAPARDQAAVGQQDEKRMRVLRILFLDVSSEVGLRIALEHVRQIERDGHAEASGRLSRQAASRLRDDPDEQHRLHDEHRREKGDDAQRDSPVEAAGHSGKTGIRG
jgi:hypothetical protein